MTSFLGDVRLAVRSLARRPGFTAVAVLALALGIGANTAIFSVVNAVLLRPLALPESDRLVTIYDVDEEGDHSAVSGADIVAWQRASRSFAGIAAYRQTAFNASADEGPVRLDGAIASRSFFSVLGVRPILGRVFDASAGAAPEVVLGEKLWRSHYHADPGIVGRGIELSGERYVVAGVVGDEASYPPAIQLWVSPRFVVPQHPLRPTEDPVLDKGAHYLDAVARLAPGTTIDQARDELGGLERRLHESGELDNERVHMVGLHDDLVGSARPQILMLFGAVGLILLIACTNVAHLLLARASARRQEVAIRLALGASRWRLARLFIAESSVLVGVGAGLGLLAAMWLRQPLLVLAPRDLEARPFELDVVVLAFTFGVAAVTALAFGVLPALAQGDPASHLHDGGRGATGGSGRVRVRSVLVAAEVALSLVLLVGAGLLVRSLRAVEEIDPGFGARTALSTSVFLPAARYPDATSRARFYREVVDHLRAAPVIEAAGAVTRLPLGSGDSTRGVMVDGRDKEIDAGLRIATPGYLSALELPLRAGRDFTDADGGAGARVVLVNEAFARIAWPGEPAIGKHLTVDISGKAAEVVGVVADVRYAGLDRPTEPEVYEPVADDPWPLMTFVVRGRGAPAGLAAELRRAVGAVDSSQAVTRIMTMNERIDATLRPRRSAVGVLGSLAGLALVLALVGVYGVIAYSVAQRTRELGIRMALGARPRSLFGLVVGESMRPVLAGIIAGLVLSLAGSRVLATLLFGVGATDPATFAVVPCALLLAALGACLLAARRATRVDPMVALRSE
jgi:putative ABC transport system permease protein